MGITLWDLALPSSNYVEKVIRSNCPRGEKEFYANYRPSSISRSFTWRVEAFVVLSRQELRPYNPYLLSFNSPFWKKESSS